MHDRERLRDAHCGAAALRRQSAMRGADCHAIIFAILIAASAICQLRVLGQKCSDCGGTRHGRPHCEPLPRGLRPLAARPGRASGPRRPQAIDWYEAGNKRVRRRRRRLRPLVRRRRSATPASMRSTAMSTRGRGEQAAIIYDCPVTGTKRTITYRRAAGPRCRRSPPCCAISASARATASSSTCRWCRRR